MESKSTDPEPNVVYADGLDYHYRDASQVFVGQGEVLIEFANVNRAQLEEVTIVDRIVLSLPSAVRLANQLQVELNRAKEKFDEQRSQDPAAS